MAAAGANARFDPVRLQKYFFLLDRELEGESGCPHFDFQPYRYGPFDPAVYGQVEQLASEGLAIIDESRRYRLYGLTEEGLERGDRAAATLPERTSQYMAAASDWLFSLALSPLLLSIYDYAPDMAAEAIRPGMVEVSRIGRPKSPFLLGMARTFDWSGALSPSRDVRPAGSAALVRHWIAVGGYLRAAMKQVDAERIQAGALHPGERGARGQAEFRLHIY